MTERAPLLVDILSQYRSALRVQMETGGDEALEQAHELGRRALEVGAPLCDLSELHYEQLRAYAKSGRDVSAAIDKSEAFFLEVAGVYDMALGGFSDLTTRLRSEIEERRMIEADLRDATFELSRQRDSLETRVAERTLQLERQAYALQSVNSALERSNEHLSSFAHIASHDMREPLRSMSTHLHLLEIDRAEEFSDEAKHRLGRIKHLARRMEKMVSDLLEFAQISDGQDEPSLVDPVDVIESIRENLADFILKHKADIQVATSMPNLYVPKSCLNIIFQNLIQNGIKYNSSQNKVVSIGCDASVFAGEQPIFYVLDNGIGIDPSVSAQIFTMFKRVSRTNDDGDGTGSGLSFVKRVIEGLGGKIWLDSKVGVGSTFYFSLGRSVLVEEKGAKDGAGREKTHSADR